MTETDGSAPRHRSPAYPAFGLQTAVAKLQAVHQAIKRSAASTDAIKRALGYNTKTSHAVRALSGLIQFGLLEEEAGATERRLKLSEAGLNIVLRRDSDPVRMGLVRDAALKPTVYGQLAGIWTAGSSGEDALSGFLLIERNFNPTVVPRIVRDFKATYQYAGLADAPGGAPGVEEQAGTVPAVAPKPTKVIDHPTSIEITEEAAHGTIETRSYHMPLQNGRQAVLQMPADISADEIDLVARYLALMKDVIAIKR